MNTEPAASPGDTEQPQPTATIGHFLARVSHEPGSHDFELYRQLDEAEHAEITRASDLINALAKDSAYQRCLDLHALIRQSMEGLHGNRRPAANEIEALRAAIKGLHGALTRMVADLTSTVAEYGDEETCSAFATKAEAVAGHPSWPKLTELADSGQFLLHRSGACVWQANPEGAVIDPWRVVNAAIAVGQTLVIERFIALGAEAERAATRLRQLTVEVLENEPLILDAPVTADRRPELTKITPRNLAIGRVAHVMQTVRKARTAAERAAAAVQVAEFKDEVSAEASDSTDTVESPSASSRDTAARGSPDARRSDEAVVDGGESDDGSGDSRDEEPEPEPQVSGPQPPADLASVFGLVRTLDEDLRQVWSSALEAAAHEAAIDRQIAALSSLLGALQRQMATEEKELEAAGHAIRIEGWPPTVATLLAFDPSPDPVEYERQLRMAQVAALSAVVQAIEPLREPSGVTVTIGDGPDGEEHLERFWEWGAFNILRDRVALLERLTNEHSKVRQAVLTGEDMKSDPGLAFEHFRLAGQAYLGGDPEAGLLHGLAAITSATQIPADEILSRIDEAFAGRSVPTNAERILGRGLELTATIRDGRPNLALTLLMVEEVLELAREIVIGPGFGGTGISGKELAELIESGQPEVRPFEPEADDGSP